MARRLIALACVAASGVALVTPGRFVASPSRSSRTRSGTVVAQALPISAAGELFKGPVFAAAIGAVSRLVVTTTVGAATVKAGIVTPPQISALAKMVYNLFLPCFLFCSVIRTVAAYGATPALLAMPFAAGCQVAVAFALSRFALLKLVGIKDTHSDAAREVSLCGTFGNPGVLPLLFFDALFANHRDPSALPKLVAFASFYLMGYTPVFWALGNSILAVDDPDAACLLGGAFDECIAPSNFDKARKAATAFFKPPPVRAALAGFAVAVSPLRGLLVGESAKLSHVYAALSRFAGAYLPAASLVLAGSLVSGSAGDDDGPAEKGFKRRVAAISLQRFVLLPAIGSSILYGLASVRLFPTPLQQPLLWFFLLTQFSMPPAQNTVVMLQLRDNTDGAARMAKTLLTVYSIAALPLTVLFNVYLRVCGLS